MGQLSRLAAANLPDALHPAAITPGPLADAIIDRLPGIGLDDAQAVEFMQLLTTLSEREWDAEDQAALVIALTDDVADGRLALERLLSHDAQRYASSNAVGDVDAVRECLLTVPPAQIRIERMLSKSGHEKLVFLARSTTSLAPIVLKRFRDGSRDLAADIEGEIAARKHPNLVHTDYLENERGEPFFTEEHMETVLGDGDRLAGYDDAANLLFDTLSALAYLHGVLRRIHGDLKPDNLAKSGGRYQLLDFGNSTRITDATMVPSASFRTRAPELLTDGQTFTTPPYAADVWALGATLFHFAVGRFPLFDVDEDTPDTAVERLEFRATLHRRAEHEYDTRVVEPLEQCLPLLQPILRRMLARDPQDRPTAKDILQLVEHDLGPYLRHAEASQQLSPRDELALITEQLETITRGCEVPRNWMARLRARLTDLENLPGWSAADREVIAAHDTLAAAKPSTT